MDKLIIKEKTKTYGVKKLAKKLQVSRQTIYDWINEGKNYNKILNAIEGNEDLLRKDIELLKLENENLKETLREMQSKINTIMEMNELKDKYIKKLEEENHKLRVQSDKGFDLGKGSMNG